jgi:hypothetical protein
MNRKKNPFTSDSLEINLNPGYVSNILAVVNLKNDAFFIISSYKSPIFLAKST